MRKIAIIVLLVCVISALAACALTEPEQPADENAELTFSTGKGAFADGKTSLQFKLKDGAVTIDSEPLLDGHAFAGWYSGEEKFDAAKKYTASKTFTAKYVSGGSDEAYDALFNENNTVAVDINMSDGEWTKLNQDFKMNSKSPIYRLADSVTISISNANETLNFCYEEVGVRMKGNTSRHEFYGSNGFTNNIHMKLSFKETFDDEDEYKQEERKVWTDTAARDARKDRTFGGMEKIDVKYNSTGDETYVRELYAMKLFRENGIYASNMTLCSLTALEKNQTKKNLGVYRILEPIDEAFVARHIEKIVGDLWKCTYTTTGAADMTLSDLENKVGVEDELKGKFYSYDKKTNKKKDKVTGLRDLSSVKNFITAINADSPDFDKLLDLDYFAKFEAINYILGNPDCIRNNYNNYYLYFRSDGKALIIPFDYDRCLGINSWDPTGSANMNVTPYTRTVAATGGQQVNPLYVKLIDKGAPTAADSVLMKFRQNLINISKSQTLTASAFNAYKDNYKAKYSKYTATALGGNSIAFDSHTGSVSYATYIQTKLKTLNDNINNYNP